MKSSIISFAFVWLLLAASTICMPQTACETSLNSIASLYKNGEWEACRDSARYFITTLPLRDRDLFVSKLSSYCKNNIYQVYFYMVKSCLRLYDLGNAKIYYFEALQKEYNIDFDSTDNKLLSSFGKLKKYSVGFDIGSVSTNLKTYKVLNEFKIGAVYGFGKKSFLELAYLRRSFTQNSDHHFGFFGKALNAPPGVFPSYSFTFKGHDQFIDLSFFNKYPIYQDRNSLNYLYFSAGAYVNYYLNSSIDGYEIKINKNVSTTEIIAPASDSSRYHRISTTSINMDLKRLYDERFNYGVFIGYGSNTRLSSKLEMSLEGRLTIGKNYHYRLSEFKDYKVGVDYFSILVCLTRRYNKIKMSRVNY